MKKTVVRGTFFVAIILSSFSSFSQCKEWKWPESPEEKAKAEERVTLYTDAYKGKHFKQAQISLNWLLVNTPNLNTSIYINGADIYDQLAGPEKDEARKQVYVDSLMIVYDLRIKNCGEEAAVLNRKANHFVKYYINKTDKLAEALSLMDKAFELNGNNTLDASMLAYMSVVRQNKLKLKTLTDDQIIQRYDKIMEVLDAKIKKAQSEGKPVDKYKKMQDDVNAILVTIVTVDCKFVKTYLEPKFKQNPNDMALAKKIFSFMLQGKCIDDPLWLEAGESIHRNTPVAERDCGLAKTLGKAYLSADNMAKAEEYLKEAQSICKDNADKGEAVLYLGSIESKKGDKRGARELYRQAGSFGGETAKEAYEKIGDLYFNSFNDCAEKKSQADDRMVYLIAYDYYQKAGNGSKMSMAKQSFPSKAEIFEQNIDAGSTKVVGCWINESTTVRTRD